MSRTRAILTALTLIPVLLVAGCSDDDPKPKFEPPPSETPSSASTSPTAAPAMSPEDTVRAWVDAQNSALRTGDTSALAAFSADPCKTCDQFIEPIARVHANGGSFQGGSWTVAGAKARPSNGQRTVVDVGVEVAGGTTKESSDAAPIDYEAAKHIMQFRLVPVGDGWAISFIGFVS